MISRFHVKNFRSIVDMNVSFTYDEGSAPKGYRNMDTWPFLTDKTGRYIPCLAIYGANASGKTNIIRALSTLNKIIKNNTIYKEYQPNKLHPELHETIFDIEYSYKNNLYHYILKYNEKTILSEALYVDEMLLYNITRKGRRDFSSLEQEEYSVERLNKIYIVECCIESGKIQHTTYLGRMASTYSGLNEHITRAFQYWKQVINICAHNEIPPGLGFFLLDKAARKINKQDLLEQFIDRLRNLDLDINKINYKRITEEWRESKFPSHHEDSPCGISMEGNKIHFDIVHTWHTDISGKEVRFNLEEESAGTQLLFGILALIMVALQMGQTLIIDEIDRSIHPLILKELIRFFKGKEYNRTNAQIIFTTHSTDLIDDDLLRVSEIAVINKTLEKGTTVVRLSQFNDIRNVTNFRKRYLEGAFRGIPYPYI
ncbi:MAG: AAA family ATPase [Akkermansia sp.]|nr:ATP-binding protein [Akkermansia sp.]MCC8147690.1 AAA family ATPase [Akkermansia sp.]